MPISTIDSKGLTSPLTSGVTTNTVTSAAATALTLQSAGTTAITVDTSQNVGIGTASPTSSSVLDVVSGGNTFPRVRSSIGSSAALFFQNSDTGTTTSDGMYFGITSAEEGVIWNNENTDIRIATDAIERMRITNSGTLLVGRTAQTPYTNVGFCVTSSGRTEITRVTGGDALAFYVSASGNNVGAIVTNASSTGYLTSSDYRLKENIAPMTGALAKVAQLKPVTYKWKADGKDGQGFIAHELAEVVPDCVNGEKDGVETYKDEDGNEQTRPKYQGIDTSFLVATLTAAIQELKAIVDAQAAEIAELKTKVA